MHATTPTPVLRPGVLYVAGDRLACAKMRCAGQTALYSGSTIDGVVLRPLTGRDVIEYASARPGFARVTCECGHLRALFSMRDGLSVENVPSDRERTGA